DYYCQTWTTGIF
nr:immunoglobulin light chain junction region [Macaca mulatta]MOY05133.1 immunoglobulin light chain junction region [Macaca mulatta]MOY05178.1 immunoglobulin light chain junction region [Macaca mulatta]MOY05240.1 immunoglobulin light chain junction region [Macaca mulatta]MOY05277.1 immunoglobulin light chain junction region [Macaca mulatta]